MHQKHKGTGMEDRLIICSAEKPQDCWSEGKVKEKGPPWELLKARGVFIPLQTQEFPVL